MIDYSNFKPTTLLAMYRDLQQLLDDPHSGYDEVHNDPQRQELVQQSKMIVAQLAKWDYAIQFSPAKYSLAPKRIHA